MYFVRSVGSNFSVIPYFFLCRVVMFWVVNNRHTRKLCSNCLFPFRSWQMRKGENSCINEERLRLYHDYRITRLFVKIVNAVSLCALRLRELVMYWKRNMFQIKVQGR